MTGRARTQLMPLAMPPALYPHRYCRRRRLLPAFRDIFLGKFDTMFLTRAARIQTTPVHD